MFNVYKGMPIDRSFTLEELLRGPESLPTRKISFSSGYGGGHKSLDLV